MELEGFLQTQMSLPQKILLIKNSNKMLAKNWK